MHLAEQEKDMHDQLRILAPVDLTRNAEAQVQHAIAVSKHLDGDLTLLYVIDPSHSRTTTPVDWPPTALASRSDRHIRHVVRHGPVAETVNEYAEDFDMDLVLLTSRRYGGWARRWAKSSTATIVAATRRPVCISKASNRTTPGVRLSRVVCVVALDGSDDAVVRYADSLATRTHGKLHLLHVMTPMPEALLMYSYAEIEWRRLYERSAAESLAKLTESVRSPHATTLLGSSPLTSISRTVREYGADLVVTGRPPPEGIQRARLDLRTLFSRLSCPLLSVPTGCSDAGFIRKGGPERCLAGA
jgi:nucleotide-binding universal stress UspA family protein